MADIFTPQKRSWVMSRIRSKNTSIDLAMKQLLSDAGARFVMYPKMDGNPDFAIPSRKVAIFCDGDFWHGYNYRNGKKLKAGYWRNKIEGNMRRDRKVSQRLRYHGWSVLRFWEHDLKKRSELCARKIKKKLEKMKNMD
jgi:DNA mismatch endonuclease (patch repair protein)